jgi:cell wall-associated NlpC family hydrolase
LPGQGTRRSFFPGTSSTQAQTSTPSAPGVFADIGGHGGAAMIAVNTAVAQLGKPYVYGATGPNSFDCSGLTQFSWAAAGVHIPRTADEQWHGLPTVSDGSQVPGDLCFYSKNGTWAHHVAMVTDVANNQMINAPHTGDVVRYAGIRNKDFVGFGRPG